MITHKQINLVDMTWEEKLPNDNLSQVILSRISDHKYDPALAAVVRLHYSLKSQRPIQRVLNLLEVPKDIVTSLTAETVGQIRTWQITKCHWDKAYVTKERSGDWYNQYRTRPSKTHKLNLDVWKFEDVKTKKFFLVAEKKDIPNSVARRLVNNELAVLPNGTYNTLEALAIMSRFIDDV